MDEWVYPYAVKEIQLSPQLKIAYIDEGKHEQTLLFIHGLGSYLKGWWKNIGPLSQQYRCIAIDLPGYGKSSSGNYPYTPIFFAEALRDFIVQLSLNDITVVGHSMGGQIAVHLALMAELPVSNLVLIAPAGFETFTPQDKLWIHALYEPGLLKKISQEQMMRNFYVNFHRFPDDARFMIEDRQLLHQSAQLFDHYCEMIPKCVRGMLEQPIFEKLKEITKPVLILFGEDDQLIPNKILHPSLTTQKVAAAGAEQIRHSQLIMIRRCGHFVPWEQHEAVNKEIIRFLG
jgi:pimeloyl-ACP methyl ester carboxylesterase